MSYDYQVERPYVMTDEGQRDVVRVFREAQNLCDIAGVARCDKLTAVCQTGDSFKRLACVDRCVEMGLIHEVTTTNRPTQHRVYEL